MFLLCGLLSAGDDSAAALWTAQARASGELITEPVSARVAADGLDLVLTNDLGSLRSTGFLTITNPNATPATASVTISGAGALAERSPLAVWPSDAAPCGAPEPPVAAVRGSWAGAVVPEGPPIAGGSSVVYCFRTEIPGAERDGLADPSGSAAAESEIAVALSTAGWGGMVLTARATILTSGIYPLVAPDWLPTAGGRWFSIRSAANRSRCLQAAPSGAPGGPMLGMPCVVDSHQVFEPIPVEDGDGRLVMLRPAHEVSLALTRKASGQLVVEAAGPDRPGQEWWLQSAPGGTTLLVSALDGRCAAVPERKDEPAVATDCGPGAAVVLNHEPVKWRKLRARIGITWEGLSGPHRRFRLQSRPVGAAGWTVRATSSGALRDTLDFPVPGSMRGLWELRIIDTSGRVIVDGMTVSREPDGTVVPVAGFG